MSALAFRLAQPHREDAMFARLATFAPAQAEDASRDTWLREELLPTLQKTAGFQGFYMCVEPATGKALSISLWHTAEALEAGQRAVQELARSDRPLPRPDSVQTFNVVFKGAADH